MELKDIVKEAVVISESVSFRDALEAMINKQTNTLLVSGSDGTLSGEVSVSDLMDAVVPEYLDGDSIAAHFATTDMFEEAVSAASDKLVVEFMNTDIEPIQLDDGLMAVAAQAIAQQKARIPVVDHENRPIGIISRRGLKELLANSLNIRLSS